MAPSSSEPSCRCVASATLDSVVPELLSAGKYATNEGSLCTALRYTPTLEGLLSTTVSVTGALVTETPEAVTMQSKEAPLSPRVAVGRTYRLLVAPPRLPPPRRH